MKRTSQACYYHIDPTVTSVLAGRGFSTVSSFLPVLLLSVMGCGTAAPDALPSADNADPSAGLAEGESVRALTKPVTPLENSSHAAEPAFAFYTVDHYGDERDAAADLAMTLERANAEKKHVLLQVGGDWCGWCSLLTKYIAETQSVNELISENYLLMKVTYSSSQKNEEFLSKFPAIQGYPHLFVLDAAGSLLHSQGTGELEMGKGYDEEKVKAFLNAWKPSGR